MFSPRRKLTVIFNFKFSTFHLIRGENMNKFDWIIGEDLSRTPQALRLARETGKSPVVAALALSRGIKNLKEFDKFCSKSVGDLFSPFLLKDMDKAVERINLALENGEHITIYGDYDVDGITSVSSLALYLKSRGGIVNYYIPDRSSEGYGINTGALCSLFESGTSLLITVDTGITACKEIDAICEMGMDVIITDHHSCKETVPECSAVINPTQPDCPYPFKALAGVGVVFKLISALEGGNQKKVLDMIGDIVALGTIADVVSLESENRIIVSYGLERMKKTANIGLKTLIEMSGIGEKAASVSGIGYGLAPKINAAGRIGDASCGVTLLMCGNAAEAEQLSDMLMEENRHRQEIEKEIYDEAVKKIEKDKSYRKKPVLVVWGEGWHSGIIGIVSSKISEKYSKPCLLITVSEGIAKGSGRSVEGFNLFEAMNACGDIFIKYGGHSLAAGLTLKEENLEKLDEAINEYAADFLPKEGKKAVMKADFELDGEYITTEVASQLETFEPCGTGNPQPVFAVTDCTVKGFRLLGEGKHLRLSLEKDGAFFDAIAFGMGADSEYIITGDKIDIIGNLTLNTWNDISRAQFVLRDFRYGKLPKEKSAVPERTDFACLYSFLKGSSQNDFLRIKEGLLLRRLGLALGNDFSAEKLNLCMRIFAELKLINFTENEGVYDVYLSDNGEKVNLESSNILKEARANCGK